METQIPTVEHDNRLLMDSKQLYLCSVGLPMSCIEYQPSVSPGPPASAPTILTAVPAHLSLTLQWSALSAPYNTSLQYELHITEVNSNSGAMVVTLNETQYNLTRTERTCAKFLFQVAAFNAAGRGPNSTVLTASLPSGTCNLVL